MSDRHLNDAETVTEGRRYGRSSQLLQVFGYTGLVLTAFIVGLFLFWSYQPTDILTIKNDPVPVKPTEVDAGEGIVYLNTDFCKNRKATGVTRVFLVGETKGQKPEISWPLDTTPPQCLKTDVPLHIPASAQTDTYHAVFEITYQVNPLKKQVVTFHSRSFSVVNIKLQPGDAKPVVP